MEFTDEDRRKKEALRFGISADSNGPINEIALSPGSSFDQELFYFMIGPAFLLTAYPFGSNVSRELFVQLVGGGVLAFLGAVFVLLGCFYLRSKRSVRWNDKEFIYTIEFLGRISQKRIPWADIKKIKQRRIHLRTGRKNSIVAVLTQGRFVFAQGIPAGESIELAAQLDRIRTQIQESSKKKN